MKTAVRQALCCKNMETGEYLVARAKTVILATGGAGRLHYQGFPTSNHYGATADGLILAYRAGAKLLYQDTLQYHPTGAAFPEQIFGALVTEKVRSLGAMLINSEGEAFMHPLKRATSRQLPSSANARRARRESRPRRLRRMADTPMIDMIHGEGTLEKRIPAMLRMYMKYDIDMREVPILVYPTLHYQNGGVDISVDGQSGVENLFIAGEAVGGIHGRNRLMGNSLLDIIVFGRNAGKNAAAKAKNVKGGKLTLRHVEAYAQEMADAGIVSDKVSPLLLPDLYAWPRKMAGGKIKIRKTVRQGRFLVIIIDREKTNGEWTMQTQITYLDNSGFAVKTKRHF